MFVGGRSNDVLVTRAVRSGGKLAPRSCELAISRSSVLLPCCVEYVTCTSFGFLSIASAGSTWCLSPATSGLTVIGPVHVLPPSSERMKRTFDPPLRSPKARLVELDHAR